MWLTLAILFFATILAGLLQPWISKKYKPDFRAILNFAGGYLFALTLVHQIPELFHSDHIHADSMHEKSILGLIILCGFFFQVVLEKLSGGIEHGHFHAHNDHQHGNLSPLVLLIGLGTHSLLEGAMLGHGALNGHELIHGHFHGNNLLLGILLHKVPAAFALTAMLNHGKTMQKNTLFTLAIFALASPLGVLITHWIGDSSWIDHTQLEWISALVTGSFLHISCTIFFENSGKEHRSWKGFGAMGLGTLVAIATEFIHFH
ncbi:ZIP family metal transporter [Persicobacter psychrovividus]|uniref:Zinc transporter ZupT n=1 Tax=Persicobacter psychrovividus TaxID=387638 RepID=A0ABM7VB85_9BACT|nr:hypothetical protein PEPS_04720 [Persicobacter psychrovividus]